VSDRWRRVATLVRLQVLLAVRGLPEGRGPRARAGAVAVIGLAFFILTLRPTYTMAKLAIVHAAAGPHANVALTALLGRVSALSGASCFVLSAVLYAQIVNRPDMRVQAASPLSSRLIIATTALGAVVVLSVLLFILAVPLIAILADPLSLGPFGVLAACLVLLTGPALPASLGLLLAIVLLRVIPAARARGLTAFLGSLISVTIGLSARLITHFSPRGPLGDAATTITRLWDESPLTWDGRALAAVARRDVGAALVNYGAVCALTVALLALCAVGGRNLLSAGWFAYTTVDDGPDPMVRRWWPWARRPARIPAPLADALVVPLPRALSQGTAEWRLLLAKERVLAWRDGGLKGRAMLGIYSILMVTTAAFAGASALSARELRFAAHSPRGIGRFFPPMVLNGVIVYAAVVISCGGLLVALVDGAWAREMGVRGIMARTPLTPARILGALGLFYIVPCAALELGLMTIGTLGLALPATMIASLAPVAISALAALAALTLTANVVWPGRAPGAEAGGSAGAVHQSWRARSAASVADMVIGVAATVFVLALLLARRHLLATLCIDSASVATAVLIIVLCRGIATRAHTRRYSGACGRVWARVGACGERSSDHRFGWVVDRAMPVCWLVY